MSLSRSLHRRLLWYDWEMIWLSILILYLVQAAISTPVPAVPDASGVYYLQDKANWISLHPAVFSDAKAQGMKLFVDTGGYTNLGMNVTCPGARASVRMPVRKPTLYIRGVGSAKDAMVVRLKQKKDSRVFKTSFSNVTVQNKAGFQKKDIRKLRAVEYPDGSFSVTPEEELAPGEYLLVFGSPASGYDFGIDEAK
jgi:hypothetical protein